MARRNYITVTPRITYRLHKSTNSKIRNLHGLSKGFVTASCYTLAIKRPPSDTYMHQKIKITNTHRWLRWTQPQRPTVHQTMITHSFQLFQCLPDSSSSQDSISSRPSNPFNSFLLAPQIRLLPVIVRVYNLYLLTYSLANSSLQVAPTTSATVSSCNPELWPMTLTWPSNWTQIVWRWTSCLISRSKFIHFNSYCPDTDRYTGPTESEWTTNGQ